MKTLQSILSIVLALLLLSPDALLAQSSSTGGNVRTQGTPAANDCVKFVSKNVITSAGGACGSGSGTVSSVTGTANQIDVATGTTTPVLSIDSTFTFPGTVTNNLSIFGATTSAQLAGVISDETGSGALVFGTSPTLVTPALGTPASGVLTNATGLPWNAHANPGGNLSLTMGANTSIFNTTTAEAQMFAWKNTTAAVVGTSQGSPIPAICGTAFHGSASVEDCMTLGELPGNGNDAAIIFTLGHTGTSTGAVSLQVPSGALATPAYSFTQSGSSGLFWNNGTTALGIGIGGTSAVAIAGSSLNLVANLGLGWSTGAPDGTGRDTAFSRDAAGVVDLGTGSVLSDAGRLNLVTLGRIALTGTNTAGNAATVLGGLGTGNAAPGPAFIDGGTKSTTSGTTAQTQVHRQVINDTKTLSTTSATATTILSLNVANDQSAGVILRYTVIAKSATDTCTSSGVVTAVAETNSGGTSKSAVNASTGIGQASICTGADTLAVAFTISAANPAVLQVTPTWATIVPTTVYIIYSYDDLSDASSTI